MCRRVWRLQLQSICCGVLSCSIVLVCAGVYYCPDTRFYAFDICLNSKIGFLSAKQGTGDTFIPHNSCSAHVQ